MHQDLLNDLINSLTILPGVGKKSAQRMALYLLDKNKDGASILAKTMLEALENVNRCKRCRMLTSNEYCNVCADTSRDNDSVCVVESPSDVLAIILIASSDILPFSFSAIFFRCKQSSSTLTLLRSNL